MFKLGYILIKWAFQAVLYLFAAIFALIWAIISGIIAGIKKSKSNQGKGDTVAQATKQAVASVSARSKATPHSVTMARIDKMEGHAFEEFTADLLRRLGYQNVRVTPGSGDQGVDVLATREGKTYAIQCKRYGQKLGNKPVQEVHAGKTIYGCSVAVVVTNNYFTEGGKEAAAVLGVELWDRDVLQKMINVANFRSKS